MSAKAKAAASKASKEQADELKRRARRRLVGSVVLLMATFIIVPAVIETEPERTPSPIELVTPGEPDPWEFDPKRDMPPQPYEKLSQDQPLNSLKVPEGQNLVGSKKTQTDSGQAASDSSAKVTSPSKSAQTNSSVSQSVAKQEKSPSSVESTQATAKASQKSSVAVSQNPPEKKPSSKSLPVLPEKAPVSPKSDDPIERFAQADVFWVQVVAVSNKKRADTLREKLKQQGFEARIESAGTDMGLIYRVRVGPIAGQQEAKGIKNKLQIAGYNGRIVQ